MATKSGRTIGYTRERSLKTLFLRWETLLVGLFLVVNIINYFAVGPGYLNPEFLFTNINSFMCKGLIALPVAYMLLLGDIDLSVGANLCLSATMLGIVYNATGSIWWGILACLATGTLCGMFNGLIVTKFTELAPMIVTLATMTLFRGLSERILGDTATNGMHQVEWFRELYYGRLFGIVPYTFVLFCVLAVVFGLVMHKTVFGRQMYAVGANRLAAKYAGVKVQKIRMIVYTLTGFICGLSAVFYAANTGSIKSDIGDGYDIETIAMCVLGGVSTAGGKGTFPGVVISIFIIGLLRYGLGRLGVLPPIIKIVIGGMLIAVVLLPNLKLKKFGKKA